MAYTLSELLQDVLDFMGQLRVSTATGGSTTTVVDSKLATSSEEDDTWNKATLFVVLDAGGAGASPQGEFQFVSDYDGATGTFTVDPFSAAIVSGDTYAWASEFFPVFNVIKECNSGLRLYLSDITLVDSTTLDSAASQTEYVGAVAWKRKPPFLIEIQGRTGDSNDNKWTAISNWKYVPAAAGTGATIEFREQPLADRDLRIWYQDSHPKLNAFGDVIHETVHPKLAFAAAAVAVLEWQTGRMQGNNSYWLQKLNDAKDLLGIAKLEHKIWQPPKQVSGIKLGNAQYQYSGERW